MNTATNEPSKNTKSFKPPMDADSKSKPVSGGATNVSSLRNESSKSEATSADKSEENLPESNSNSKKSESFVEQLDYALLNASISVGEIVKKIEALTPKEGGIAKVSGFMVDKLNSVQTYLGEQNSKSIASSAWKFVRRSPWPVGLAVVGAGVGYFIQKGMSSEKTPENATQSKAA